MRKISLRHIAVAGILSLLAACGRGDSASNQAAMPKEGEPMPAAPAVFTVRFETSEGPFVVEAHRDWSPNGVDRFHELVASGYFEGTRFFRVVSGFVVQFGLHGDPSVASAWEPRIIPDDSTGQPNLRGTLVFATAGPNTRTTQLFINLADNRNLDGMGFTPIGRVVEGMDVVDRLHAGYGDGPPFGGGPDQGRIAKEGNAYLERDFPELDFVRSARIVSGAVTEAKGDSAR